jgi:hypothetical protein
MPPSPYTTKTFGRFSSASMSVPKNFSSYAISVTRFTKWFVTSKPSMLNWIR